MSEGFNASDINSVLQWLENNWNEARIQGEAITSSLFQISVIYPQALVRIFIGLLQPIVGICCLCFSFFILYIFIREKMTGFVHCLLIASNVFGNLSNVLSAPINIFMFNISNINVPAPFPWCFLYYGNEFLLRPTLHVTSLYLKLLLAINRVCCVFLPFHTTFWFTKKRNIVYGLSTCFGALAIGASLNFTYKRITIMPHFDDIWGIQKVQEYEACSILPSFYDGNNLAPQVLLPLLFSVVTISGILALIICNAFLVVKIALIKVSRKSLGEIRSKQMKSAEKRINLLSRVSLWIISATVVTEIPSLIALVMGLEHQARLMIHGVEGIDEKGTLYETLQLIHLIATVILTSLDLVIFVVMSNKTKAAIRKRFCKVKCRK